MDDATRLAPGDDELGASTDRRSHRAVEGLAHPRRSTGWLSSSGAIDHGRFEPGTLLDGRYRIVERLGRGGMGEVYRADDLKLGQPVALKFLPPDVDKDPARLTQLHTEVRMARQVSHPNVCRVYDIDEVDGTTFLSMEYVDGEDLSSLLKRVGRFPEDRALEIARQICAGLAAAHERNVIHRDLKPANVMLDGTGKVRITDFGLAGASGEAIRAGTPAYMAPEQLVRRRGHGAERHLCAGPGPLRDLHRPARARRQEPRGADPQARAVRDPAADGASSRARSEDRAGDHAVPQAGDRRTPGVGAGGRRIVARRRPARRRARCRRNAVARNGGCRCEPGSAVDARDDRVCRRHHPRARGHRRPLPAGHPAQPRADAEAAGSAGGSRQGGARRARRQPVRDRRHSASGVGLSHDYARFIEQTSTATDRWELLRTVRPETFFFWYRTSPRPLVPWGQENQIGRANPPLTTAGMTLVAVDANGRLSEFHRVPEPIIARDACRADRLEAALRGGRSGSRTVHRERANDRAAVLRR